MSIIIKSNNANVKIIPDIYGKNLLIQLIAIKKKCNFA